MIRSISFDLQRGAKCMLERSGFRRVLPLTGEPDLHLLADGRRVNAIERRDYTYVFYLGTRPWSARVVSRSAAPQEIGIARDPRQLGVAVRQIVLAGPRRQTTIGADMPFLRDGFHAFEPATGIRWTDGYAAVPMEVLGALNGPTMLSLHLCGTTQYIDEGGCVRAA